MAEGYQPMRAHHERLAARLAEGPRDRVLREGARAGDARRAWGQAGCGLPKVGCEAEGAAHGDG
eukprot:2784497-Prymnesium_polylepis.1